MSLTDEQIEECVRRYKRERDRYDKMAEFVYEKCQDLLHGNIAVRATVQRRTKNPDSFRNKLKKNREKYGSVEEVFDRISDLAAVRIATYQESEREKVVDGIKEIFAGKESVRPEIDEKEGDGNVGRHYRATHCQVYLAQDDLNENNDNLIDTTCEIQVCSLLAHVFNEIEHDLQYKTLSGELSESEREFINQLGLLTKAGDLTIKRLLAETENRLADHQGEFDDVFEFIARMKKELEFKVVYPQNAGQLYEELKKLGLNSLEKIKESVCEGQNATLYEVCRNEFNRLYEYEKNRTEQKNSQLEKASSDLLLAGVLRNNYQTILENNPTGRGKGRPTRLTQIAKMYADMVDASHSE